MIRVLTQDVVNTDHVASLAVRDWLAEIAALDRELFRLRNPGWFLVGRSALESTSPLAKTISTAREARALQRHVTRNLEDAPSDAGGRPGRAAPIHVWALRKRSDLFANMITVGRTGNNDVHLPDFTISKFHAYFHVDGPVRIVDAGSHNGTRVNGARIMTKMPVEVGPGAQIELGRVLVVLHEAEGCWDAVRLGL
jgi:hypothetical protein